MDNIGISRRAFMGGALAALSLGVPAALAKTSNSPDITNSYKVGDSTTIVLNIFDYGPGKTYFAPHNSETTCVAAALEVMQKHGGRLLQVINDGQRYITFTMGGKTYLCDPNRIFSTVGIVATLNKNSPGGFVAKAPGAERVVREVAKLAFEFLTNIRAKPSPFLIALHNNTPGAYSLLSYMSGGDSSKEVVPGKVHQNTAMSPDDFFFVTTEPFYKKLVAKNYNVALQDALHMTDDGSLSVYYAKKHQPYINVEAQNGHEPEQVKMIEFAQGL